MTKPRTVGWLLYLALAAALSSPAHAQEPPECPVVLMPPGITYSSACKGWFIPDARVEMFIAHEIELCGPSEPACTDPDGGLRGAYGDVLEDNVEIEADRQEWKRKAEKKRGFWGRVGPIATGLAIGVLLAVAIL